MFVPEMKKLLYFSTWKSNTSKVVPQTVACMEMNVWNKPHKRPPKKYPKSLWQFLVTLHFDSCGEDKLNSVHICKLIWANKDEWQNCSMLFPWGVWRLLSIPFLRYKEERYVHNPPDKTIPCERKYIPWKEWWSVNVSKAKIRGSISGGAAMI